MLQGVRLPGKVKPTARDVFRAEIGRKVDWLTPGRRADARLDQPGVVVCPRCHAISVQKRWFLDEARYQQLKAQPGTHLVVCPGCRRIERQMYDGEVLLSSPLLAANKTMALQLIRNEEERARQVDPLSRLADVDDRGSQIAVLTTTVALAERIGKAFRRSFKGSLRLQYLPGEQFVRVRWKR
jgi:hypothetical protein